MRSQGLVDLGADRHVKVQELRVRDARNFFAQAKKLKQVDIGALLTDHFDELTLLLGDCIAMPPGETLEDLTFSEVALVKDALLEVNADFFALTGIALEKELSPETT